MGTEYHRGLPRRAVADCRDGNMTAAEIARKHGVGRSQVRSLKRRMHESARLARSLRPHHARPVAPAIPDESPTPPAPAPEMAYYSIIAPERLVRYDGSCYLGGNVFVYSSPERPAGPAVGIATPYGSIPDARGAVVTFKLVLHCGKSHLSRRDLPGVFILDGRRFHPIEDYLAGRPPHGRN